MLVKLNGEFFAKLEFSPGKQSLVKSTQIGLLANAYKVHLELNDWLVLHVIQVN